MKPIQERNPVPIAVIGLVLVLVLGLLAYRADDLPVIGGGTTYTAHFTEAAGLNTSSEVRVAGVKVGKVTGVRLDRGRVKVSFRVKDVWIGNASTVAISIQTLLGDKYLAVAPLGSAAQNPRQTIPTNRTRAPYDVTQAFGDLGRTFGQLDTAKVAQSLQVISATFRDTPPDVRKALDGMTALSRTISSRDDRLARLLAGSDRLTGTLASQNTEYEALLKDGNLLLEELRLRREAIHRLLVASRELSRHLVGLVRDNEAQLAPTLTALDRVAKVLQDNQRNLDKALAIAGPYYRLVGNTLGNGRWTDAYLCGLVPKEYLKPGTPPANGCMPPKVGGEG
ncbi:phospholipid/cholesterol/gamma-HCH transport system substrate-binding protein [Thermomonospora echinospora]|uniref:Phospholipid/cholesterol/gamma-HCH transport system substrate-binding protein n=1 Tax=Thermomonospora echinospora TaxID=1992 RepID=A0A1H5Y2C5_9ACTN|nr:MCE family protein [Thermomonospora echinospora]SEG17706.1 phospholipid/cholesterol/gamma-HCH transport system substrate-binding protein [Thermomonospora echinospora]